MKRAMRVPLTFLSGLPLLAFTALFARPFQNVKGPVVAKDGQFATSSGGQMQVDGLCSIEDGKVRCWSATGRNDGTLAGKVESALMTSDSTYTAHFHRRTILIAVTASMPGQRFSQVEYSEKPFAQPYSRSELERANIIGLDPNPGQSFYWFFALKSQKRIDIYCQYWTSFGASRVLKPTTGAETTIKGFTLRIRDISEALDRNPSHMVNVGKVPDKPVKIWNYICDDLNGAQIPTFSITLEPLDKNYNGFGAVDENGVPTVSNPFSRGTTSQVIMTTDFEIPVQPHWVSTVDPKYVNAFDVEGSYQTEVEFPNLPLYHR